MSGMAARRAKIIRFPTRPASRSGRPAAGSAAGGPPAGSLVEARRCRDQAEALVVRGLLESEGIRVVLQSRLAQSVYPFSVGDQAEVLLLVVAADLPRARAVLARRA
jgi:putative signal transducing protein